MALRGIQEIESITTERRKKKKTTKRKPKEKLGPLNGSLRD